MNNDELQLIYQPVPPDPSNDAFASALARIRGQSEQISLTSPYLSFKVVEPLVRGRSFRLLTDLGQCLERRVNPKLAEFLLEHHEHIRSLGGLHAKVVLGAHEGLLGSANLTETNTPRPTHRPIPAAFRLPPRPHVAARSSDWIAPLVQLAPLVPDPRCTSSPK